VAEKGNVIKNAEGKAIEMYGVTRDITNEKIREQLLLQAKNMAEEAYRNQETFFSFMSHEIRTPLNAILGLTNLLSAKKTEKKKSEIVKALKNAGDNLMHVVDGLLDLTKSRSGNNTAAIVDFKLFDSLYQLESSYRFLAREKGIGFILVIDPKLPALLRGDVVKLYQVLNNLLDNAVKFTQEGFVSLRVSAEKQNKNKHVVRFCVEDTGIGIPANNLDQLFKPFHRLTFDIRKKGTGLGLRLKANRARDLFLR
jgi:signal transduction histidine kinase